MPALGPLATALIAAVLGRLPESRRAGERGYSTEFVVITAAIVAVAIIVVGVITAKTLSTANGIQTR